MVYACRYRAISLCVLVSLYIELEVNFQEADYLITEGSPLSVLLRFRSTENPFTLTIRPVPIASAEDSGLGSFINCARAGEDARATPGTKSMVVLIPEFSVSTIDMNLRMLCRCLHGISGDCQLHLNRG